MQTAFTSGINVVWLAKFYLLEPNSAPGVIQFVWHTTRTSAKRIASKCPSV